MVFYGKSIGHISENNGPSFGFNNYAFYKKQLNIF